MLTRQEKEVNMIDMIGGGVTNRRYELLLPIDNVYLDRHDCREATAVGGIACPGWSRLEVR